MGLLEVVLRQRYFDAEVLNRWHYQSSGTPAAVSMSFALASAFGGIVDIITGNFPGGTIMNDLQNVQNTELFYVELQVENLYDVVDFYAVPYSSTLNGLVTGTPMSKFYAFPLQSNRVRTDIGRGNKRFAGVTEEAVGNDGVIGGAVLSALTSTAEAMSDTLEYDDEGNTLSFTPVVLSFPKYTAPSGKPADKKYATLSAQLDHAAIGVTWTTKANATTQNSRKR